MFVNLCIIKREKFNFFCVWFIYFFLLGLCLDDVCFKNCVKIYCVNVMEFNVWLSIFLSILICFVDKNFLGCFGIFL